MVDGAPSLNRIFFSASLLERNGVDNCLICQRCFGIVLEVLDSLLRFFRVLGGSLGSQAPNMFRILLGFTPEHLNQFLSFDHAKQLLKAWRFNYNHRRPHGALGHLSPAEYVDRHNETGISIVTIFQY
jgi:hypothetical protein